jgi:hypothetical protein
MGVDRTIAKRVIRRVTVPILRTEEKMMEVEEMQHYRLIPIGPPSTVRTRHIEPGVSNDSQMWAASAYAPQPVAWTGPSTAPLPQPPKYQQSQQLFRHTNAFPAPPIPSYIAPTAGWAMPSPPTSWSGSQTARGRGIYDRSGVAGAAVYGYGGTTDDLPNKPRAWISARPAFTRSTHLAYQTDADQQTLSAQYDVWHALCLCCLKHVFFCCIGHHQQQQECHLISIKSKNLVMVSH